jgi:hypothetical protein
MRNPQLVAHTPVAIAMTNLFLYQMAMLAVPMSECQCLGEESCIARTPEEDVHAEYDQERSGSNCQVAKDLMRREGREQNINK